MLGSDGIAKLMFKYNSKLYKPILWDTLWIFLLFYKDFIMRKIVNEDRKKKFVACRHNNGLKFVQWVEKIELIVFLAVNLGICANTSMLKFV